MGVRFECPGGHKLNVKAELAGKRGICPECGARFVVPTESGGRASPAAEASMAPSSATPAAKPRTVPSGSTKSPPVSPGPAGMPPIPSPALSATAGLAPTEFPAAAPNFEPEEDPSWHVRTAAGGQFGPASNETLEAWIAEGRVGPGDWIWRSGWAEWRPAREAGAHLPAAPQSLPPTATEIPPVATIPLPQQLPPALDAPVVGQAPLDAADATIVRKLELRRRQKSSRNLALLLGVVALVLLGVAVWVLSRKPVIPDDVPPQEPDAATAPETPA